MGFLTNLLLLLPSLIVAVIGASVGAFLAIPTGLWIDRRTRLREQREITTVVLRAIKDELYKNKSNVKEYLAKSPNPDEINVPSLSLAAWEASQSIGILTSIDDYELHKALIGVYEKIAFISNLTKTMWNLFFTSDITLLSLERRKILEISIKEAVKDLSIEIDQAVKQILQRNEA